MNRKNWLPAIALGLLGLLVGGVAFGYYRQTSGYIPPLKVLGDVAQVLKLEDPKQLGKLHALSYNGHKYQAVKLKDILAAAHPIAEAEQIYLTGSDGFISSVPARDLEQSYIVFTAQNGWEAINLKHPVNSNVKMLKEIVVVSNTSSSTFDLSIINQDKELARVTPGQLYTRRSMLDFLYPEGQASVENEGKTYTSSVYTRRRVFRLADLTPVPDGEMILLMGANGEHHFLENRGYFELKDNYVNYFDPDERIQLEKVNKVIVDPPAASIMDTFYDARHYLENGEKVLVIVLDGFTYSKYTGAMEKGQLALLKNAEHAVKAAGVYPLDRNVWLAAMITGEAPEQNGIIAAKDRELKTPSIFAIAKQLKKQALFLYSGSRMLNTEVEALLLNDQNASGTADDELYALSLDKLPEAELIILCFDGLAGGNSDSDGWETGSGPAAITTIEKYLQELSNRWPGRVIITGTPGKLSQRDFTWDSIFVPYLCLK